MRVCVCVCVCEESQLLDIRARWPGRDSLIAVPRRLITSFRRSEREREREQVKCGLRLGTQRKHYWEQRAELLPVLPSRTVIQMLMVDLH